MTYTNSADPDQTALKDLKEVINVAKGRNVSIICIKTYIFFSKSTEKMSIFKLLPVKRAITLSPCFHFWEHPGPCLSTVPEASKPNISLSPGGGGYSPFL